MVVVRGDGDGERGGEVGFSEELLLEKESLVKEMPDP